VGGEAAVPIGELGWFGTIEGGDVDDGGSHAYSARGECFGEVGGSELEEVLLLHFVFPEFGIGGIGCGCLSCNASTSDAEYIPCTGPSRICLVHIVGCSHT